VVISPDGSLVVASHDVGTTMTAEGAFVTGVNPVQVWDTTTLEEIERFDGHEHPVRDLAYAPDGRSIFSAGGGREGVVLQWEPRTGELVRAFRGGSHAIVGVGVSQDGVDLFAVDAAGKVMRWDAETGEGPTTLRRAGGACRTFDVTADGALVAIGTGPGPPLVSGLVLPPAAGRDDAVLLLDTATRETLAKLDYSGPVETLALSADGSILAAWSTGDVIRVWDVAGLTDRR
jgi:WD40 repeat protein